MGARWRWTILWLGLLGLLVGRICAGSGWPVAVAQAAHPAPLSLPAAAAPPADRPPPRLAARRTPGAATILTTTISIPTYPYADCLQSRSGGPAPGNYPYHWLDWGCYGNPSPAPQSYRLLVLENDYAARDAAAGAGRAHLPDDLQAHRPQRAVPEPGHQAHPLGAAGAGLVAGRRAASSGVCRWTSTATSWGEPWATGRQLERRRHRHAARYGRHRPPARRRRGAPARRAAATLAVSPRMENPTGAGLNVKYWANAHAGPRRRQHRRGLSCALSSTQTR